MDTIKRKQRWQISLLGLSLITLMAALVLSGTPSHASEYMVKVATADVGTSSYIYANTWAAAVNKFSKKVVMSIAPTKGTVAAFDRVIEGKAQVARHSVLGVRLAREGIGSVKPYTGGRLLWYSGLSEMLVIVRAGSKYHTLADLKGCRLGVPPRGSIGVVGADWILRTAGYDMGKDFTTRFMSYSDLRTGLKDGILDAIISCDAKASPNVIELAESLDVRILELGKKFAERVNEACEGGLPVTDVRKGVYKGVDKDISVNSLSMLWATSDELPENVAYEITKIFFDHFQEIADTYVAIKAETTHEILNLPETPTVPYHPGAKKALIETGRLKK